MNTSYKALLVFVTSGMICATYAVAQQHATAPANEINIGATRAGNIEVENIEIETIQISGDHSPARRRPEGIDDEKWKFLEEIYEDMATPTPLEQKMMAQQDTYMRDYAYEMKTQGYLTVSHETLNNAGHKISLDDGRKPGDVVGLLAFDSAIFSGAIDLATVPAVFGTVLADGKIHALASVIEYAPLDALVTLQELPFDDPKAGIDSIRAPKYDLDVNGHPASLTVMKSADGQRGTTELRVRTENVLASFGVARAITQDDPEFNELLKLVKKLY